MFFFWKHSALRNFTIGKYQNVLHNLSAKKWFRWSETKVRETKNQERAIDTKREKLEWNKIDDFILF